MTDIIEKLRGPNPVSWLPEAIHEIERLRAALESVLDSGLLVGPTVMHDKIRGQAHAALALRQYQANEVCMGGDA